MPTPVVEALKKIEYQILKTLDPDIFTDEQLVYMAQSILNANLNTGDIIIDIEMQVSMLGVTLDWSVGGADNLIVGLSKGSVSIIADLGSTDTIIPGLDDAEAYSAALALAIALNNDDPGAPDSGYIWVDYTTALSDALTDTLAINNV